MIASGYLLTLYCDRADCVRPRYSNEYSGPRKDDFAGETGPECRRRARKVGWWFVVRDPGGAACCPSCRKTEEGARWVTIAKRRLAREKGIAQRKSRPRTIMVDELVAYPTADHARFRAGACHLTTSGSLEELHAFAARLGLRRTWFQDHRIAPHYDLTAPKRAAALRLGAAFVPALAQARARRAARTTPPG